MKLKTPKRIKNAPETGVYFFIIFLNENANLFKLVEKIRVQRVN